ncbi:MAG: hypothetical protein KDC95_17055 [Planctomycetes bacterium]|nr:hypothetical protein [Planctomycetota bacterium]
MRSTVLVTLALATSASGALISCASRSFAPGEGRGLVTVETQIPRGVTPAPKPRLRVGDRFVYRRGGALRIEQTIVEHDENGIVLEEASSHLRTRLGTDLQQVAQDSGEEWWLDKELVPGDWQLTFPLWPGKRWACEFLLKRRGEDALPVLAKYHCDRAEDITTPAGTFACLRIWRIARPLIEGRKFLDQATLFWYAPEVGNFVRRFEDGTLTELEEFVRQGDPDSR